MILLRSQVRAWSFLCNRGAGAGVGNCHPLASGLIVMQLCLLVLALVLPSQQLMAQSGGLDVSPPEIEHESLVTGKAGEMQTFSVNVSDDRDVRQVVLFYRSEAKSEYANVLMREVADLGKYSASVTTKSDQKVIEYYIEASDTGGNRVLKGFPFYPLVRQLEATQSLVTSQPIRTEQPRAEVKSNSSKVLYIVLGIVAVGALVAASDKGSGTSAELVPLSIGVTPP